MSLLKPNRLLFFTDSHFSTNPVGQRLDNFEEATLNKLEQIVNLASQELCKYVICGGDFFHRPFVSAYLLKKVFQILSQAAEGTHYIVLPGNHDLPGNNLGRLDHSALGFLNFLMKLIPTNHSIKFTLLTNQLETEVFSFDGIPTGSGQLKDLIETGKLNNAIANKINIGLIHAPYGDGDPRFMLDYKQIESPGYKYLLFGDIHSGFGPYTNKEKTVLINPSALARRKIDEANIIPKVLIIDSELGYKFVELNFPAKESIFDLKAQEERVEFLKNYRQLSVDVSELVKLDLTKHIKEVAKKNNLDSEISETLLTFVGEADGHKRTTDED